MKRRKKKQLFQAVETSNTTNFTHLLQKKFGNENFTIVSSKKNGYWQDPSSGMYHDGGFTFEAQVFTTRANENKPDIISFSVCSTKEKDPESKEQAAKGLVEKLRRLDIAI